MLRLLSALALVLALSLAPPARAFTPESGFYWNPVEGGSGIAIEIQDNFLFLAGYIYDTQGKATWVTAQGTLTGNSIFNSVVDTFTNGACQGCAYRAPTYGGSAGPITITFTSETRATLTWLGRTIQIERFVYALGDKTALMQGEWQAVLDFYDRSSNDANYPFYGDVLLVDSLDRSRNPNYFLGCRARDSEVGFCTANADRDHDVAGFYNSGNGEHVIVVKDQPGAINVPAVYFAYFVKVGTDQFDGVVEEYNENQTVGDGPFYPVRGFRSASKTFVLTGTGPSSSNKALASDPRAEGLSKRVPRHADGTPRGGLTAEEVKSRYGIDPRASQVEVQALVREMSSR